MSDDYRLVEHRATGQIFDLSDQGLRSYLILRLPARFVATKLGAKLSVTIAGFYQTIRVTRSSAADSFDPDLRYCDFAVASNNTNRVPYRVIAVRHPDPIDHEGEFVVCDHEEFEII